MKICIMGYSGAGKSTLARALSQKLNIPCLHLDSVYWYGDWQNRSREEVNQIIAQFAAENSNYIIEGNYGYAYPQRFEECDVLVFLACNRFVCFRRAFSRYKKFKGRPRPDLPCPEKFDFEFAKWILWDGRTRSRRRGLYSAARMCRGEVYIIKTQKQLDKFLLHF
ncbi:MAG TPA: AAA family ATPase [Candidatus Coproplasma excrementipullorum]|nr:AAA family ATPase [Candidatus Coproplasma excrementipullorum]